MEAERLRAELERDRAELNSYRRALTSVRAQVAAATERAVVAENERDDANRRGTAAALARDEARAELHRSLTEGRRLYADLAALRAAVAVTDESKLWLAKELLRMKVGGDPEKVWPLMGRMKVGSHVYWLGEAEAILTAIARRASGAPETPEGVRAVTYEDQTCDRCKVSRHLQGIGCQVCKKWYWRCADHGGLAGAKRSLHSHIGLSGHRQPETPPTSLGERDRG